MGVTGPGKTCQKKKQKSVIWENNLFQNIIEGNTGSENCFFLQIVGNDARQRRNIYADSQTST